MKTKLLFTILFGLISFHLIAQETQQSCKFDYTIEAKKSPKGLDYEQMFVEFSWDVSKIVSTNDEVFIELVKIYDCYVGIDGVQTEAYTSLNLKSKDLMDKNSFKIKHIDMIAKCFKWRVILKSDTCLEQTKWNYLSFID